MKKLISILLFFGCVATIFAQQIYQLDSILTTQFDDPFQSTIEGHKYNYDNQDRLISIRSESLDVDYEYESNKLNITHAYKHENFKLKEETLYNSEGTWKSRFEYFQPSLTGESELKEEYHNKRNIFGLISEEQRYKHKNDVVRLHTNTISSYNVHQLIEKIHLTSYDFDTQVQSHLWEVDYFYNDNLSLKYEITQTILPYGIGLVRDSTDYEYDQFNRLAAMKHYREDTSGMKLLSENSYEYYDDHSIETIGPKDDPYRQIVEYYSTIPLAPFDKQSTYHYNTDGRYLYLQSTFTDISDEMSPYDFELLDRYVRFNSIGQTAAVYQHKKMYKEIITEESVLELESEVSFQIISNPVQANNYFNLLTDKGNFEKILLYDMNGKLISTQNSNGTIINTLRSPNASGTYLIRLINGDQVVSETKKMVVL
ncbi:T9SS type A sorting domain-containing protein [Saprospiraceae bacterium]|nr:T9SS type A sorting domain-containing protein [Saprospiraceae bacterium]